MRIWNNYVTSYGTAFCFRRKHPADTFAGLPGIYALTIIDGIEVQPLQFFAADDLACADERRIATAPEFRAFRNYRKVGVAVCILKQSTPEQRASVASALNDMVRSPPQQAA